MWFFENRNPRKVETRTPAGSSVDIVRPQKAAETSRTHVVADVVPDDKKTPAETDLPGDKPHPSGRVWPPTLTINQAIEKSFEDVK